MTAFTTALIRNDRILFVLINRRLHCQLLDRYFGAITQLGSTPFMILLASGLLYWLPTAGEPLALNLLVSQMIIHAFKRVVNRQRPYQIMECNLIYTPPQCIYSFPSGHSGAAFSAALVLSACFPDFSFLLFTVAASISFSRIYLGFHFVSDVAAGLMIAYLTFQFFQFTQLF